MSNDQVHRVQPGDCFASIADLYGFFWKTLWELPENSALKNKRKNPNILMPGDEVFVPAKRLKYETKPADATHKFVRRGVPSRFRVRLLSNGRPRSGLEFTCAIDDASVCGTTDSDGVLGFPIPPGAKTGILRITDRGVVRQYTLAFGTLNPVEEISGIQQRLKNLGYRCKDTGELDQQTQAAISSFRADKDLHQSDSIDATLRSALRKAHGA